MERSKGDMSLKNPVTPPGIDPGTVRLVAQRLNHYATPDFSSAFFKFQVKFYSEKGLLVEWCFAIAILDLISRVFLA
jgi:hypothetical protein